MEKEIIFSPQIILLYWKMGTVPALLYFKCIDIALAYLLEAVNNQKHNLYINTMNAIDSTFLFFGIFIAFSLWHWNKWKEKNVQFFFLFFFFFILDQCQKKKKNPREKLVCSQVRWNLGVYNFSPLITLFFLWMFMANIPSEEPLLAHHSLSPEQQSVCTHVAKPWPFLSILLTRMLSSLVCSFLSWWTYFRRLVVIFHICLWCDGEPWGSVSSLVFQEPLQRLCEMCFDDCRQRIPMPHRPSRAERPFCSGERGALVCLETSVL